MHRVTLHLAGTILAAALLTLGCSSTAASGSDTPIVCSIALSGGVISTPACTGTMTYYSVGLDSTFFTVQTSDASLRYFLELPPQLHTGIYRSTDLGANDEGVSFTAGTVKWTAGYNGGFGSPAGSSYTLNISSRTVGNQNGDQIPYTVHGTADATLVSKTAGTIPITVHITF